jgi:hypothetical protein
MLYAHTRDHNASTNADYTNEVCQLKLSMWDYYLQTKQLVTLGRQSTRIARQHSYIKLKCIKNFCLSCKSLAFQVTCNPIQCNEQWSRNLDTGAWYYSCTLAIHQRDKAPICIFKHISGCPYWKCSKALVVERQLGSSRHRWDDNVQI